MKRTSKEIIVNVEIRKERTSMELLEKMLNDNNIKNAMERVVSNKGTSVIDGMKVEELYSYFDEHGEELKEQIRTRKYKPSLVRRVYIPKKMGISVVLEYQL